jgi:hypothetical protein
MRTRRREGEKQLNTIDAPKNNPTQSPASRHIWTQIKGAYPTAQKNKTRSQSKKEAAKSPRKTPHNMIEQTPQNKNSKNTKQENHKEQEPQHQRLLFCSLPIASHFHTHINIDR